MPGQTGIGQASFDLTSPFFLFDLANIVPLPVFIVNTSGPPVTVLGGTILGGSNLGGADPLGGSLGNTGDTLQAVLSVNAFSPLPKWPIAVIEGLGLALSPTTNLLQAVSGLAFCPSRGTVAQFVLQTAAGSLITVSAAFSGRQNVNVRYGTV